MYFSAPAVLFSILLSKLMNCLEIIWRRPASAITVMITSIFSASKILSINNFDAYFKFVCHENLNFTHQISLETNILNLPDCKQISRYFQYKT